MKKNDSGDFSVLYIEASDERTKLFPIIAEQKKPVVLMLAEQAQAFQRPDDFTMLKRMKRQLDLPIVFVIPAGGQLAQLAARNGFPVYLSMDTLADALSMGQLTRARMLRTTNPLEKGEAPAVNGRASVPNNGRVPVEQSGHPATYGAVTMQKSPYPASAGPISEPGFVTPGGFLKPAFPRQTDELEDAMTAEMGTVSNRNGSLNSNSNGYGGGGNSNGKKGRSSRELVRRRTNPPGTGGPRPSKPLPGRTSVSPAEPPHLTVSEHTRRPGRLSPILLILTIALLIGVGGAFLVVPNSLFPGNGTSGTAPGVVGRIAFTGSGHLSENSTQGIGDQVTVELTKIAPAPEGKSYYAWLLGDRKQSDPKTLLLGKLEVKDGQARLFYGGDAQHSSLLLDMSRFLVTEEDAAVNPIAPSPDQSTWRFQGAFSEELLPSSNGKQYSYLDHLRHLLVSDPTLNELELPGGLNNWFYRNSGKVLEWSASTREMWEGGKDVDFLRRQLIRCLQFLDGTSFVARDLPPGTPLLVNERLARIGLIQVDGPNQQPPSFMSHIVHHLNGLLQASGSTTEMRQKIAPLVSALANVEHWMSNARTSALEIMKKSDDELRNDPETLNMINNVIDNANHAYTGEMDPLSNKMREGATWVHRQMQTLALLDITVVSSSKS